MGLRWWSGGWTLIKNVWDHVKFQWEFSLKGRGNVPTGLETVGGTWGTTSCVVLPAKFQLQVITTRGLGSLAMGGPVVWHANRRAATRLLSGFAWPNTNGISNKLFQEEFDLSSLLG